MNSNLLRAEIVKKGMTHAEVAKQMGVTAKTFSLKLKKGSFGVDEANKLIELLEIEKPLDIFFPKKATQ